MTEEKEQGKLLRKGVEELSSEGRFWPPLDANAIADERSDSVAELIGEAFAEILTSLHHLESQRSASDEEEIFRSSQVSL